MIEMDISYIINQLGEDRGHYFDAIAPPIIQTSNFRIHTVEALRNHFENEMAGYLYSRGINPTVDILRKKLAALDGAEDALLFNSGAAALFAGVLSQVKSGDHIVSVKQPYSWAQHMFDVILPRFGVSTTYVDGTQWQHYEEASRSNTVLYYMESPNSWNFALQDIRAIAQLAKRKGIITFIDNSYSSPLYQRPISMGVDLCMQTATKYISGHSDTLGGVLSGSREIIKKIFDSEYLNIGSGLQPFNAWLLLRGLRTLPIRLQQITRSTREVLAYLKEHPKVERVYFPLDPSFPQYDLACRQMEGACGLLTMVLKSEAPEPIELFCESLKHFQIAVSWGGHESLVMPRVASIPRHQFNPQGEEHRMVRLYIGLEESAYLVKDLEQALEHL